MILKQDLGELWFKVSYCGPGLAGKRTNMQFLWESFRRFRRAGDLTSLASASDRTLFTDLAPEVTEESQRAFERSHRVVLWNSEGFVQALPKNQVRLDFGRFEDLKLCVHICTVPGPVFCNESRRLILEDTDGVLFIADSQKQMLEANIESMEYLAENLKSFDRELEQVPLVLQFNKRDLRNILSLDEMNQLLNPDCVPWFEAVASKGIGVLDTLHALVKLMRRNAKDAFKSEES